MANNCRLIDISVVLKHFDGYGFGQECDAEIILDYIAEGAPTVDAVEVVHGRWEYCGGLPICPVCGYEYTDYLECNNYCGNCGAKMDGGNSNV